MSHPYEELKREGQDEITDQQREQLSTDSKDRIDQVLSTYEKTLLDELTPETESTGSEQTTPPSTNKTQTKEETTTTTKEEPKEEEQSLLEKHINNPPKKLEEIGEILNIARALGQGPLDYANDLTNLIPGVNLPSRPKFNNPVHQSIREVASLVLPMVMFEGGLKRAAISVHKSGVAPSFVQKLGNNQIFSIFAKFGLSAGVGAFVDSTNRIQEEDHNLQGYLKKTFPRTYQWIPNTWATQDSDSPDIKRAKNANEGVGLNLLSDIFIGTSKIVKAGLNLNKATSYIPKNENAIEYFKKVGSDELENIKFSENPVEDAILRGDARQKKALDELGEYFTNKADLEGGFTEPKLGVHDVFDPLETGVRTPDPDGIVGATVDAARIQGNLDTANGRLGSIITDAARKKGLETDTMAKRVLVNEVLEHIKASGKYDALVNGKVVSWKQIDEAGTKLAEVFIDPRMDTGLLKGVLDGLKNEVDGIKNLNDVAYDGVFKTIKRYMDEYMNMDVHKAQAYLATSEAGQLSDIAEGARLLEDTVAIERAQEQIFDRMEYLMVEKGLASWVRGSGLNNINVWKRIRVLNNPKKLEEYSQIIEAQHKNKLATLIPEVKDTIDQLRILSKERPEFFKPLMYAYEMSDGNIDTMHKLNNFVRNSLGTFTKAFYDGQPEIPSIINRAIFSNIYNSMLSAFATPLRAGLGNLGGIISEPVSLFAGALASGDLPTIKRGLYMYGGIGDSLQKASKHMGFIYRKAANDPYSVSYIIRDDIALKQDEGLQVLKTFADAAELNGDFGPSALYNLYENQEDLAIHPWLRVGANSMTALDGFTRAFKASAEAKARALDAITASGRELNNKTLKEASDQVYSDFFDSDGFITDKAVDYGSREIALNLDSDLVQGVNAILRKIPALRPFLMFPKTAQNMVGVFHKYSPGSMLAGEYNKIGIRPVDSFSVDEVTEFLRKKNIPVDEHAMTRFREQRAIVRGRVAIGVGSIFTAGSLFTANRLRGNGHHDPQRQRTRKNQGWKPRTYKGWDGNWYSYDGMGPLSDWLSLVADVMDNFDLITSPQQEEWFNKLSFILGANLTSKTILAQLEPMNDVLAGNPAALNRWAASFGNSMLPVGGQRNEWARIFTPQLKELDMEFLQLFANRNPIAKASLPDTYDMIDGKQIGYPENVFVRLWNAYSPSFKMHGGDLTPERQFLIDIEYDAEPSIRTNGKGIEYTPTERSEIKSIMGQQGYFKKALQNIMADAKAHNVIKNLKELRKQGYTSEEISTEDYLRIIDRINEALTDAVRSAEAFLSNADEIREKQYEYNLRKDKAKRGILPLVDPNRNH